MVVVLLHFLDQIFRLLKVNLEFRFHIFIPFKWQFHKIIWIINKPHRAYNFYDKTKWDFLTWQTWLHQPCSGSVPVSKDWQQEGGGAAEAGRNLCVHHKVFVVNYQRNLLIHHKVTFLFIYQQNDTDIIDLIYIFIWFRDIAGALERKKRYGVDALQYVVCMKWKLIEN